MPNKLILSSKAYHDIDKIREWYNQESIETAERFLDEINVFSKRIAVNPERFKKINKEVKRCLLKKFPYILFFSEQKFEIIILRVRHKKQKPLKRFK